MQQKWKTPEMKTTKKMKSAVDKPTPSIRASNWKCSTEMRKRKTGSPGSRGSSTRERQGRYQRDVGRRFLGAGDLESKSSRQTWSFPASFAARVGTCTLSPTNQWIHLRFHFWGQQCKKQVPRKDTCLSREGRGEGI